MKKLIRIVATISALVLIPVVPAWGYDFVPTGSNLEKSGKFAFTVEDQPDGPVWISLALAFNVPETSTANGQMMCHSFSEDDCATAPTESLGGTSILPICGEVLENCLAGVKIYKAGEAAESAKFLRVVPGLTFPSDPKLGNPRGATPSIWESNVVNAGGSNKYVVIPRINYHFRGSQMEIQNFSTSVYPVTDKSDSSYKPAEIQIRTENGLKTSNTDNGEHTGNDQCVATDKGWCAYRSDFTKGTRVELELKLSNSVTGWLHGRLKNPEIKISKVDASYNSVNIAGDPVEIPMMYATVDAKSMDAATLMRVTSPPFSLGGLHQTGELWYKMRGDDERAQTLIKKFASAVSDTAAETYTSWQVKSIATYTNPSPCIQDTSRLVGLVTTNAMAYSPGTPSWDGKSLNYQVAGLHYMPDGKTAVEGTYELAIRSDAARCLYGFSKAPISATINVTGANGETKTATTVVSERDGWLKLAAYGFTFSSPTISVKLSQAAAPAKKTTITCVKGRLTKKVTAVGPKCPAGYKKK
jgi:hypothetical protein